jgi:hypothetical protein
MVSFMLTALPSEKEPLVPIGLEAGWAPGLFWVLWKREKFLFLPVIESRFPSCAAHTLLTIIIEQSILANILYLLYLKM